MNLTELRNLTWPLLHQPMAKEDVARGIAVTYGVDFDEALSAVMSLHKDIDTCVRHIHTIMGAQGITSEVACANARKEIGPLEDQHYEAMWSLAMWLVAKGC